MSEEPEKNANMSNELGAQEAQLRYFICYKYIAIHSLPFRSRYGNIDKRKGSAMLMKKLQGKNKQYFDSGDYNMAKGKPKAVVPNPLAKKSPTPGMF